jgi:hypothetical protein
LIIKKTRTAESPKIKAEKKEKVFDIEIYISLLPILSGQF